MQTQQTTLSKNLSAINAWLDQKTQTAADFWCVPQGLQKQITDFSQQVTDKFYQTGSLQRRKQMQLFGEVAQMVVLLVEAPYAAIAGAFMSSFASESKRESIVQRTAEIDEFCYKLPRSVKVIAIASGVTLHCTGYAVLPAISLYYTVKQIARIIPKDKKGKTA